MSVVAAQGLSLTYPGNIEALKNVDLSIEAGEFVSFIGPSGCGKTTLLRVVADLEQPTGGTVLVTGQTPEEARQARAYGYVFQAPALFEWRSVLANGVKAPEFAGALAVFVGTLDRMESELVGRAWLSGERFGLADASLLPYVLRLEHLAAVGKEFGFEADEAEWIEAWDLRLPAAVTR